MANITLSAGNSTASLNSTSVDDGSSVSRGEVFGMFLTLSFCLLSQPSGSLIYRPWPFLAWRLNPLACLAETVLIFLFFAGIFCSTLFDVIDDHRFEDIPARWRRWLAMGKAFHRNFQWQAHALACALLLVRADVGKENPEVEDMLRKLNATGLFHADCENVEMTEGLLGASQGREEPDLERDVPSPETPSATPSAAVREPPSPAGMGTSPGTTEPTTETSSQEPPATNLALDSRSNQQAVALSRAFGANVFAHRELSVQAVILLSIASVTVKLCVSSLPQTLATAAFFMLFGWLSVQALLFTFHSPSVQETGIKAITEKTRVVVGILREGPFLDNDSLEFRMAAWTTVGIAAGLPLSGIILFANIPERWDAPDPIILDYVAMWIIRVLGTGTLLAICWMADKTRGTDPSKGGEEEWEPNLRAKIIITVVIVLAYTDILIRGEFSDDGFRIDTYLASVVLWMIGMFIPMIVLGILCAVGTPVFPGTRVGTAAAQALVFVGVAFTFILWMVKYDPAGTTQPDWIKWLG